MTEISTSKISNIANAVEQCLRFIFQARVVQKVDNAIRRINHYPADSVVYFVNNYPLDRDLSGG